MTHLLRRNVRPVGGWTFAALGAAGGIGSAVTAHWWGVVAGAAWVAIGAEFARRSS